jgi:hypothetical protein
MKKYPLGLIVTLLSGFFSAAYALPKSIPAGVANSLSSAAKGQDVNMPIPITGIYVFIFIIVLAIAGLVLAIYQKLNQVRK